MEIGGAFTNDRNSGGWVFLQSLANFVRLGKLFQESREIISLLLSGYHRFKHAPQNFRLHAGQKKHRELT